MRLSVRVAVLCVLCLTSAQGVFAASPDLDDPAVQEMVRKLAAPYVDSKQVDGMSIGLIAGDKSKTFHFGKTAKNAGIPNDQTVYEIGSISKVFTGVLLADAVVQKKVSLEQDAAELLPDGVTMPSAGGKQITLKDLSTHRSGLTRLSNNMPSLQTDNPYSDYTSELAMEFLKKHQLRREPGAKMEYSNFAVSLLGNLLCRQAGESYDDLLQKRITGPLGMSNTTVTKDADVLSRLAPGHSSQGIQTSSWEFADMPGAGGIRSTIPDMLEFAKANLNTPDGDIGKALELAWEKHEAGNGKEFAMGLGWHFARDGSTRWHNGQTGGYHSMLFVNRRIPAAVVLLTNTATGEVDRLAEELIRVMAGAKVTPREFETTVEVPVAKMKRLVGRYQLVPNVVFDVKVVDDRLMVQLTGQQSLQVFPKSETEWFYKAVKASLTFKVSGSGKASELELFQNGIRQTAKRIK